MICSRPNRSRTTRRTLPSPVTTGKMDFAGNLDLLANTQFSNELLNNSPDLRRSLTAIIGQVNKVLAIKVTGTIKEPKFKTETVLPVTQIVDTVKSIFEGILK